MSDVSASLRARIRAWANRKCEYCLAPESLTLLEHEIDHIIALKHGGETIADNLALCCTLCNKHKGSDIASLDPETGGMQPCSIHASIAGTITFSCVAVRSFLAQPLAG